MTQPEELPETANGYPVVAKCTNCDQYLTLGEDYRGKPQLRHVSTFDLNCRIYRYATADRPVMEMGLFQ